MITIVDYGMGNLGSVLNMFKKVRVPARISSDLKEIENAEKLILPGVGKFDHGMRMLEEKGYIPVLNHLALEKKIPVLGICLGMHLMTESSEEGELKGLGWIAAKTKKFPISELRVPNMGWSTGKLQKPSPLFKDMPEEFRFYYVHSFYVQCLHPSDQLLQNTYGIEFTAGFQRENIFGLQFHPEKSHKFGMKIFENFGSL